MQRRLTVLSIVPVAAFALGMTPGQAATGSNYAASNTGVANIQASVQPVERTCPATADWLRDPDVCASRWSTVGNDKSESDLAVDPTNPEHIFGLSKVFWSPDDYLFNLEWFDSLDGGKTWANGLLPGYDQWADTTDPTVAFDSEGNLFTLVLAFNFVVEKNGFHNWSVGQTEPTHLNDAVYLSRSMKPRRGSAGRSWNQPVLIAAYNSGGLGRGADKQWVGADRFGIHKGSVYASWIQLDGTSFSGEDALAISNDYGQTFSAPVIVTGNATTPHINGDPYVFTGPEGNLYYSYDNLPAEQGYSESSFQVMVSHDNGQTFSTPGQAIQSTIADQSGQSLPDTYRDGTPYSMAVNPANGNLLLAYEHWGGATPDRTQWLVQSSDQGQHWSAPVQIDDPNTGGETTQAKIMAAPSGIFAAAFYDRRLGCPADDPVVANIGLTNRCVDVTIQFFNADGRKLGPNRRVTQDSWDPNVNPAFPGGEGSTTTFIGDYFGGAMTTTTKGTFAHLLFVSTSPTVQTNAVPGGNLSPPYQQQVYATVAAP